MTILILGLVLFFGIHLLPGFTTPRAALVARLGANRYRGVFSVISLLGLVLIIIGFARAPFVHQYTPISGARHLALGVMPLVFFLLAASNMATHTRRVLKHPMLIGTALWAGVHLLANGDVRSLLLFGAFLVFSLVALVSASIRGKTLVGAKPAQAKYDLMAFAGGLAAFAIVLYFHGWLFGVAIVS